MVAVVGELPLPGDGALSEPRLDALGGVARWGPVAAPAVVLAAAAALRFWGLGSLGFNSDEAVYAGQAAALAGNPVYVEDFPVFRAHPMLVQSMLSPFFAAGEHDLAGRVVIAVVGIATVALVYVLGSTMYSSRATGLLSAALVAVMPYHVVVSRQVLLDGPMVFFSTLTLLCVARFAHTEQRAWLVAAGGAMGLTLLAKESSVVLLGGIYAFLALTPRIRGQLLAVALALPVMVALFLVHPVSMAMSGRSSTGKSYLVWQLLRRPNHGFGFYFETVPSALGPLLVAAAVAAVALQLTDRSWRELLLVCWIAAPVVAFTLWPVKGFQYLLPVAPAVALLAARGLLGIVRLPELTPRLPLRHLRVAAVVVVLISLVLASVSRVTAGSGTTFLAGSGGVPGGREAGRWMARHTPAGAQVLTLGPSMANIITFYGHRKTFGLSVSPNPLHRNPAYLPVLNPDLELRNGVLQYVVWDSFSAGRSPHFSDKLRELVRRYHGRVAHREYVTTRRDGRDVRVPVVIVYEVRP